MNTLPKILKKSVCSLVIFCFLFTQSGIAQTLPMAPIAPVQSLTLLRYLSVNSANPNNYFNFLLDKGQNTENEPQQNLNQEAKKLINYFFLGITLPSEAFWVNLRPDTPNAITSDGLSDTDMGRVLLEQDLRLKKDAAQFLSPRNPKGREYWLKLYKAIGRDKARKSKIITSNRVWITPGQAVVLETEDGAFVAKANLKVLLESEYLALKQKQAGVETNVSGEEANIKALSEQLMKEIIIPALQDEVNNSPAYAPLRQVYHSLILSEWFKKKNSANSGNSANPYSSYINSSKTEGLESQLPWEKQAIWQDYISSYQKGEYKFQDILFGLKRMYWSGGVVFNNIASSSLKIVTNRTTPKELINLGLSISDLPFSMPESATTPGRSTYITTTGYTTNQGVGGTTTSRQQDLVVFTGGRGKNLGATQLNLILLDTSHAKTSLPNIKTQPASSPMAIQQSTETASSPLKLGKREFTLTGIFTALSLGIPSSAHAVMLNIKDKAIEVTIQQGDTVSGIYQALRNYKGASMLPNNFTKALHNTKELFGEKKEVVNGLKDFYEGIKGLSNLIKTQDLIYPGKFKIPGLRNAAKALEVTAEQMASHVMNTLPPLNSPDTVSKLDKLSNFASTYQTEIGITVAVLAGLGYLGYRYYKRNKQAAPAATEIPTMLKTPGSATTAINKIGTPEPPPPVEQAQNEAATLLTQITEALTAKNAQIKADATNSINDPANNLQKKQKLANWHRAEQEVLKRTSESLQGTNDIQTLQNILQAIQTPAEWQGLVQPIAADMPASNLIEQENSEILNNFESAINIIKAEKLDEQESQLLAALTTQHTAMTEFAAQTPGIPFEYVPQHGNAGDLLNQGNGLVEKLTKTKNDLLDTINQALTAKGEQIKIDALNNISSVDNLQKKQEFANWYRAEDEVLKLTQGSLENQNIEALQDTLQVIQDATKWQSLIQPMAEELSENNQIPQENSEVLNNLNSVITNLNTANPIDEPDVQLLNTIKAQHTAMTEFAAQNPGIPFEYGSYNNAGDLLEQGKILVEKLALIKAKNDLYDNINQTLTTKNEQIKKDATEKINTVTDFQQKQSLANWYRAEQEALKHITESLQGTNGIETLQNMLQTIQDAAKWQSLVQPIAEQISSTNQMVQDNTEILSNLNSVINTIKAEKLDEQESQLLAALTTQHTAMTEFAAQTPGIPFEYVPQHGNAGDLLNQGNGLVEKLTKTKNDLLDTINQTITTKGEQIKIDALNNINFADNSQKKQELANWYKSEQEALKLKQASLEGQNIEALQSILQIIQDTARWQTLVGPIAEDISKNNPAGVEEFLSSLSQPPIETLPIEPTQPLEPAEPVVPPAKTTTPLPAPTLTPDAIVKLSPKELLENIAKLMSVPGISTIEGLEEITIIKEAVKQKIDSEGITAKIVKVWNESGGKKFNITEASLAKELPGWKINNLEHDSDSPEEWYLLELVHPSGDFRLVIPRMGATYTTTMLSHFDLYEGHTATNMRVTTFTKPAITWDTPGGNKSEILKGETELPSVATTETTPPSAPDLTPEKIYAEQKQGIDQIILTWNEAGSKNFDDTKTALLKNDLLAGWEVRNLEHENGHPDNWYLMGLVHPSKDFMFVLPRRNFDFATSIREHFDPEKETTSRNQRVTVLTQPSIIIGDINKGNLTKGKIEASSAITNTTTVETASSPLSLSRPEELNNMLKFLQNHDKALLDHKTDSGTKRQIIYSPGETRIQMHYDGRVTKKTYVVLEDGNGNEKFRIEYPGNILDKPINEIQTDLITTIKLELKTSSPLTIPKVQVGVDAPGGIDLSQIEITLKDDKYVSSLNPADLKVLRAAKALKDGWLSLSFLYVHEAMLLMKDKLVNDMQNKKLLSEVLGQLNTQGFSDVEAMQFFSISQPQP